jgi:antitoxin (DNA-binding transcriptional repressor) of toxin-antitoxin stability system
MRFAGVKELKQKTMELLKESKGEDIFITAYGKPVAVLHHVDEENIEDYLIENDPVFRKRIEEAWAEYLTQGGGIRAEELLAELDKQMIHEKA